VVGEIRIYVEGGGYQRSGKAAIREGLSKFLSGVREKARAHRVRWNIVACGSARNTVEDYQNALKRHRDAINFLLVDSDGPVALPAVEHLQTNGGFDVSGMPPGLVHLMVQVMEAWILSDRDALERFYGDGFNATALPRRENMEEVEKQDVYRALTAATRHTQKGEYHKIQHGPRILAMLDAGKVRQRATHCNRLFDTLEDLIEGRGSSA